MRSKDLIERLTHGTHTSLVESIVVPEVGIALRDWLKKVPNDKYVLIGGNVVGFYTRPRATMDVDVLFKGNVVPNDVVGFKKIRPHAFQHNDTHVEVETLTAGSINIDPRLVDKVFETAVEINGVYIPSPTGLVALKIVRGFLKDLADVEAVMEKHEIDLSGWNIPVDKLKRAEEALGVVFKI